MSGELDQLLQKLGESAESLEKEAASIGSIFDRVRGKLESLRLNVDTWVEDRPLARRELSVSASTVAPRIEIHFGYALPAGKRGGDRNLLIREAEVVPEPTAGDGSHYKVTRVLNERTVEACSRDEQLLALDRLPDLIRALTSTIEERAETIRRARKLVD